MGLALVAAIDLGLRMHKMPDEEIESLLHEERCQIKTSGAGAHQVRAILLETECLRRGLPLRARREPK